MLGKIPEVAGHGERGLYDLCRVCRLDSVQIAERAVYGQNEKIQPRKQRIAEKVLAVRRIARDVYPFSFRFDQKSNGVRRKLAVIAGNSPRLLKNTESAWI